MQCLKRVSVFIAGRFVRYETYYLYEHGLEHDGGFEDMNVPAELVFKTVHSNEEADALEADGFPFRAHSIDVEKRLNAGAVAFCGFVGKDFANIGWVAVDRKGQESLGLPPMNVDYENREAVLADVMTVPEYRRMGFRTYMAIYRWGYLEEKGKTTVRCVAEKGNTASLASQPKGYQTYAMGRYIRILWWEYWKETPLQGLQI
jgi:hypothetical protein